MPSDKNPQPVVELPENISNPTDMTPRESRSDFTAVPDQDLTNDILADPMEPSVPEQVGHLKSGQ